MTADLHFDAETYGLGSGVFFVGYSLAMLPSQLLMMHVSDDACMCTGISLCARAVLLVARPRQAAALHHHRTPALQLQHHVE